MDAWADHPIKRIPVYKPGSWGPQEADAFIEKDGRKWLNPD
jgi:glucose-6-phosphate 1-dehydrogenase